MNINYLGSVGGAGGPRAIEHGRKILRQSRRYPVSFLAYKNEQRKKTGEQNEDKNGFMMIMHNEKIITVF